MHTSRRSTARCAFAGLLMGGAVFIASIGFPGCGASNTPPRTLDRALAVPHQNAIYLVPGRTAVIPVRIDGPIDGTGAYPVRFGKDLPADASLYWLGVSSTDPMKSSNELSAVERSTSIASRVSSWMELSIGGNRAFWSATPASLGVRPASSGTWVVVIRTPLFAKDEASASRPASNSPALPTPRDTAPPRPETIRLGTFETAIEWLEDPSRQEGAWNPPAMITEASLQSPWLRGTLDILAHSPQHRWRVRLAMGQPYGLAPMTASVSSELDPAITPAAGGIPTDMFLDPVQEAMATHLELQWRVALGRLAAESESTALAVAKRLSEVVDFGNGIAMPAWESDAAAISQLFELMMAPGIVPGDIAGRARLWLESRPTFAVCVTDDAGAADKVTAGAISTFLVANLTDDPAASWAPPPHASVSMEIIAVGPHSAKQVRAINAAAWTTGSDDPDAQPASATNLPLSAARAARDGVVVPIRAGVFDLRRRACPWRIPAFPPGCTVGPLRPDWTMREWLLQGSAPDERVDPGPWGDREAAEAGWAAAGMIYLGSPSDLPTTMQGSITGTQQWILYLECLRAATVDAEIGGNSNSGDSGAVQSRSGFLRIWLGPTNAPTAVYKVMPDGTIVDESPGVGAGGRAGPPLTSAGLPISARVATEKSRWSCWIPLPRSAIERDGAMRVGIERVDGRGVRSAWPRPMFPWQYEPGRAAIDTRGWTQVRP